MVDLHCHILPGVDDGAENMEEALQMARMAADSGVREIIATPHCNLPYAPRKNYMSYALQERMEQFREAVHQARIPVSVSPGAEVLCTADLEFLLQRGKLPTLAGSRYLLMEFFFDETMDYMTDRLSCVAAEGLIPVVAHPERYDAVQRNPYALEQWFVSGYVLQLNKGSILGQLGRGAEAAANWLLSQGLAHAVASDAHTSVTRTPHMGQIREYLEDTCGPDYARLLLHTNPGRILRDRPVVEA